MLCILILSSEYVYIIEVVRTDSNKAQYTSIYLLRTEQGYRDHCLLVARDQNKFNAPSLSSQNTVVELSYRGQLSYRVSQ